MQDDNTPATSDPTSAPPTGNGTGTIGAPPPATNIAPPAIPRPTRCRIVEFTDGDGDTMPAIVTRVEDNTMNVNGFHPVLGAGNHFINDIDALARTSPGEPGTWNWPARG